VVFDASKDAARLRAGLLLFALALLAVLVLVAFRSCRTEWRSHQAAFRALGAVPAGRDLGIVQFKNCVGEMDRCTTCHLGVARSDLAGGEIPPPFRAHPAPLAHHVKNRVGCSVCHGGTPRALESRLAHAAPGTKEMDPLHRQPHIQASCARCHVPGDQPGMERLQKGAELYLSLGCAICHPLTRGGRGGWDFGTDLRSIGKKSLAYLEASLVDPTANFPQSTMPSFARTFKKSPEALVDVLIYLESLVLDRSASRCNRRVRSQGLAGANCTTCHSGDAGRACGRFTHRCPYLLQRKDQLNCARCHPGNLPPAEEHRGFCPVIREHRKGCTACHDGLPEVEGS
jgi:hypothetical protein